MAFSHDASYPIRWQGHPARTLITSTTAPTIAGIQDLLDGASNVSSGLDPTTISPTMSAQHAFVAFKRTQRTTMMMRFAVGDATDANDLFGLIMILGATRATSKNNDGRENPFSLSYRGMFSIQGGSFVVNTRDPIRGPSAPASFKWVDNVTQIDSNAVLSPGIRTTGQGSAAIGANGITQVHIDPTGDEFTIVAPWCLKHASETGTACTAIGVEVCGL
jgi:hypothetical protein